MKDLNSLSSFARYSGKLLRLAYKRCSLKNFIENGFHGDTSLGQDVLGSRHDTKGAHPRQYKGRN